MDIKELRKRYKLSRAQFAGLFEIPYRTVQSWELGLRSCPDYVFSMMEQLLEFWELNGELDGPMSRLRRAGLGESEE